MNIVLKNIHDCIFNLIIIHIVFKNIHLGYIMSLLKLLLLLLLYLLLTSINSKNVLFV